jgi:hypothetical protein
MAECSNTAFGELRIARNGSTAPIEMTSAAAPTMPSITSSPISMRLLGVKCPAISIKRAESEAFLSVIDASERWYS